MELVPEASATQRESVEQVNEYLRSFSSPPCGSCPLPYTDLALCSQWMKTSHISRLPATGNFGLGWRQCNGPA